MVTKRFGLKDLFGNPLPQRRPRYERALERSDRATLPLRAARVRWLSAVIPKNASYAMPPETFYVFEEAKNSFVYGNFVAAIVLAASFVEHWFSANLRVCGYEKAAAQGLAACIKVARANNVVNPMLLDKVDQLRLIRNPFVHLKSFNHEHTVAQRAWKQGTHPGALLERDAKEALIAMYGVAAYSFHLSRSGAALLVR